MNIKDELEAVAQSAESKIEEELKRIHGGIKDELEAVAQSAESKIEEELKRIHGGVAAIADKAYHELNAVDFTAIFGFVRDLVGLMRHGAPVPPTPAVLSGVVIPPENLPKV